MRVAFLNPQGNFDQKDSHMTEHPDFGGQLIYVKEVSMALAKMGVGVDIITRLIDDPEWPEFSKPVDYYAGYERNPRILRIPCGGPRFLRKELLWEHLDEFTEGILAFYGDKLPDFATAHYGDGGYAGVLLKKKAGLGFTFTGHSLGAQKLDKLGMSAGNAGEMESEFHFSKRITAERLSMAHAFRVVTSTSQERFEQYSHPLYERALDVNDDSKFSVIPPGVNTSIFNTGDSDDDRALHRGIEETLKGSKKPCIVLSSRLDEKKNHIGAVEAYAHSKELQDKANLAVFIRGVDDPFNDISSLPEKDREVLRPIVKLIDEQNIRDKVFFFNIKSQGELAAAYRYFAGLGSVFALTAFYEPFGLAPIEAAACGLAVVATKNGGPSEIFKDGSGVLVDPFDAQSIAGGLLKGIERSAELSGAGQELVREKYTWRKTANGYLSVIMEGMQKTSERGVEIPGLSNTERLSQYLAGK
jgi:sucrose-phosphate synthase